MKKIKGVKIGKTQKGNNVESKGNGNIWPEEYEEQRSMDIRMKPQPFPSSSKSVKRKNQK